MTNITTATKLHYLPRDTVYLISHHGVKIKDSSGEWKLGCVYQDVSSQETYTRPYEMFDMDKWNIIE